MGEPCTVRPDFVEYPTAWVAEIRGRRALGPKGLLA